MAKRVCIEGKVQLDLASLPPYVGDTSELVASLISTQDEEGSDEEEEACTILVDREHIPLPLGPIASPTHLYAFLQVLEFWSVQTLPSCVVDYTKDHFKDVDMEEVKRITPLFYVQIEVESTFPQPKWCYEAATRGGLSGLHALMHFHETGCPWDKWTCSYAAINGHLECLIYAHEQGCPWDEWTCARAARTGHLDCLAYAHEQGCPWDKDTCEWAAEHGHFECLTYAHEHGCPWDEDTCAWAAENGNLACLAYAKEHGCPEY